MGSKSASTVEISPARGPIRGRIEVPGDKSIAHRSILFNAIADGTAEILGVPDGGDVNSSIGAMRALGADIQSLGEGRCRVRGAGGRFASPEGPIDCGNSGTTMRLLCGILAGSDAIAVLDGDESLRRRPMARVAKPLVELGADLATTEGKPPVTVKGCRLKGADVRLPVASAQLKSAVLLAGLAAEGRTTVAEPALSRDHSEVMLAAMGATLSRSHGSVSIEGGCVLRATNMSVPGDASSAAFLLTAAAVIPGSHLAIERVGLNPTRLGFVSILTRMGAWIVVDEREVVGGESVGSLTVEFNGPLRGTTVDSVEVPGAIDEFPILAVAAALAEGKTTVRGAEELRVKESDRIEAIRELVTGLGGHIETRPDGFEIEGAGGRLRGEADIASFGDHRIAMSAAVGALGCERSVRITGAESANVSFPGFYSVLQGLVHES